MTYRAPLDDIFFAMRLAAGENAFSESGIYADLASGVAEATLEEAAKFAQERLLPLDKSGDRIGATFSNGHVTTAPGWREAYAQWMQGGWNSLAASADYGGLGLPLLLNAALTEIWNAANMSFALCPLLGFGAIEAVEAHASEALKETLSAKDDFGRMDRHHEPDGAASWLGPLQYAHARGAAGGWLVSSIWAEDIHHVRRT